VKGTVTKVTRTPNGYGATIHTADPLPDGEDHDVVLDKASYEDLRAALVGKLPVEILPDPPALPTNVTIG